MVKQYALKQSVLEDVMEEPVPAADPLNGACQLGKSQPSPFSSRKVMYENEEVSYIVLVCLQQYHLIFQQFLLFGMFLLVLKSPEKKFIF